ncbi:hypothetical protein BDV25DRAFT_165911 [Aspergillus avenaceus]|uniref:holo-[acyl-carrier-protein] synthase n=1 Tax=Aspergillus avenaceus TaxID=36643 RepID=A0A5N6TEY6_ASPAV|nr:hypothetical protein BDV25DRAFT_165911 [Aspergillus avenaceus]
MPNKTKDKLIRWYIDTRPLSTTPTPPTKTPPTLPLLTTLQATDQASVQKYYHLKDKQMSLASNLLKYLFIHRTCRIPWQDISISRTPAPHKRPCFVPSPALVRSSGRDIPNIEFNVSHQASFVALAGTVFLPSEVEPEANANANAETEAKKETEKVQVGIDITCVNERRNTPNTLPSLNEYVDIFGEVFSANELNAMKSLCGISSPGKSETELADYGFRLFYTFWALKEAYIKMTGEALLAPWLKELVFTDVVAPGPAVGWGEPYTGVRTWLYGREVEDVRVEVVAFEDDYLVATAARGGGIGKVDGGEDLWGPLEKVDIDDIRPCAMGECRCLQ